MDINETIELSKQGLRLTAWHNGQQVEVQRIRNAKPDALGFVMFYRPAGATMQIADPVDRRVIYV